MMIAKQRIKNDFYETNKALTHVLLDASPEIRGFVFEPASGNGEISNVLLGETQYLNRFDDVMTNDIDEKRPSLLHFDAAGPYSRFKNHFPSYDWAIGNPPFFLAHEIIPNCFNHARVGVAMLLRLSYLEPTMKRNARGNFLRENADHLKRIIILGDPRPSFRDDTKGTDSVTTFWAVWDKTWSWSALGVPCPFEFVTGWKHCQNGR